ncbi:MAG: hypothetical protein KGQ44_00570 [Betaproteobacteria bacterium]|nr:hypothetical protein [Betaproteobacteria bacterium]
MKLIIFSAAAAALAIIPVARASDTNNTYFWLHPKLGMVRVDKSTNAMVTTLQPKEERASPSDKETKTILWIDPKGNVRHIPAEPK